MGLTAKNPGLAPTNAYIQNGFPTASAKSATDASDYPFGVWFANPTTLYVADEDAGDNTYDAATNTYTAAAASTTAGLQSQRHGHAVGLHLHGERLRRQGADPNKLVEITDSLKATTASQVTHEQFRRAWPQSGTRTAQPVAAVGQTSPASRCLRQSSCQTTRDVGLAAVDRHCASPPVACSLREATNWTTHPSS